MKRIFTYLIFVFSVLSCGEKHVQPELSSAVISFASPHVMQTKSVLVEDKTQLVTGPQELGYSVFAARYVLGDDIDHEQFMNDVKIYSIDNGHTWKYDGKQYYWSPGAVHKFFAVYPYYEIEDNDDATDDDVYDLGLSYAINEQVHAIQVTGKHVEDGVTYICTGTEANGENICPDILYGVEKFSEPYSVGEKRDLIKFQLSHALSAISFRFRNASEIPIKSITTQPIHGFKNASSYVRLSENGAKWAHPENVGGHSFLVPEFNTAMPQSLDRIAPGDYYTSVEAENYWYTAFMIPQNFGSYPQSPSFTFTVTFEDEIGNEIYKTYTINFKDYQVQNTAEHAYSFLPGRHYEYNLNVTLSAISCHVDVVPWIEDEPIKLN